MRNLFDVFGRKGPASGVGRLAVVLALPLTLACSAGSSAPQLAPIGKVGPELDPENVPQAFSVVHAAPRGAAALGSSISVLFSEPLRALESNGAALPEIRIEPPVAGEWRWVGSRAMAFAPGAPRLPAATSYRVSVPAGTRSLDGDVLAAAYEFSFDTPAPALVRTEPESGATGQQPTAPLFVSFNQPVAASAVERSGRLRALRGQASEALPFKAKADPKHPERIEIVPQRRLPLASTIELEIQAGLVGREGPRPFEPAQRLRFETYGPLAITNVGCHTPPGLASCDPEGSVWVELSNPATLGQFKEHFVIEPAVALQWPEELTDESRYFYLSLPASLAPKTAYRLQLKAGLRDVYGQALGKDSERTLTTGNYSPRVRLPISGEVFPVPLAELGLEVRNAPGLRVFSQRLEGETLLDYFETLQNYDRRRALPEILHAREASVPAALDDTTTRYPIALGPVLGEQKQRGAAWLGWRFGGQTEGQLIQVTDLALTAKVSARGSLVWVTRLSSGAPVAGASVEVFGRAPKVSRKYTTDARGIALIPAAELSPTLQDYGSNDDTIMLARLGDDSSFRRIADFLPPWRLEPQMRLSQPERDYGLMFSERGIYRPGDVIKVKGVLRREAPSGNAVLAARKLSVQLEDPFGEVAEKQPVETNRFGAFALDLHLPGSGALGTWRITADGFPDAALGVEVAEYRPVEFKVAVDAAAPAYLNRDKARFQVRADYLFGSPMAGQKLSYGATRSRTFFAPPGSEGYVTSDEEYRRDLDTAPLDVSLLGRAEAKLSASGSFDLTLPLVLPGQIGPEQVRLDADVTDVSRQVVAASAATIVHPASHYVGIGELESWFVTAPSVVRPRVLAFAPDGTRVPGRKVSLELVRRRWTLAREKTESGWQTRSVPVDEKQASCELTTAAGPTSCDLGLAESGQFFIRALSRDGAGRSTASSLGFYAIGAGRASWADNDQRKLELVLDKKQYRVGDTARVLVKSPFERAEALVTVERAGIYEHRRVTLVGPTPTIELPVDERLRPNAFVAVHLVQGVAANAPPTAPEVTPEPGYRIGYAELIVDPEARRLKVELKGQEGDYRPGQLASFDLQVTRAGGAPHPAEITVYAVDEGVLALVGYQAPDPVQIFTRPRPLAVATLESRDALGRVLLLGPDRDKGEAGGGGGDGGRSDFRTTAYFNPNLETDAEGRAHVEFQLPDNLTTFRLMAVAVSEDDRYGVGSRALTVNQPLMLRPALPRALRAGDVFEAGAVVSSQSRVASSVTVKLEVQGAKLEGPAEQRLELAPGASVEARFRVQVTDPGEAKLAFAAESGSERDRVEVTRRVTSPAALEASAVYGRTDSAEAQALGDLSALRKDVGGLELQLASTALVGLDGGLTQLLDYPYACTEQLASRLLPLGPLAALGQRYGLAVPPNLGALLEAQVGEILRRQHGDGGFGLWPSSPDTHPWLSAYTLWVLWQAKQAGARISDRSFEQGTSYLRQALGRPRADAPAWATAAFMLDVLAELGKPDAEYVAQLFEARASLPPFGRALLLHAAASGGSDPSLVLTLTQELEALVTLRGNKAQVLDPDPEPFRYLFHSEARTEALVLWALLRANPKHPLAPALAAGILDRRRAGRWQNTQESAYSLLALDAYRSAFEAEVPHFEAAVWFGDRQLFAGSFQGAATDARRHRLAIAELDGKSGNLTFEKKGQGTLFYEARLRYAPRDLPSQPLERGLSLSKGLHVVRMDELEQALKRVPEPTANVPSFAGGDLVLVDLLVTAPERRHFVVIEDPLPAGFEAVDARLATTAPGLDIESTSGGEDPGVTGFQSSWYRRELRDDRVLFFVDEMPAGVYHYRYLARATTLGRFIVPPTRAEEMYQPEVFGRTAANTLEVR